MESDRPFVIVGALLNGALYLAAVTIAGLMWDNHDAVMLAIIAYGLTFLGYAFQTVALRNLAAMFCGLSWLAGIAAGLFLLADRMLLG